jgi:hypothetical protein
MKHEKCDVNTAHFLYYTMCRVLTVLLLVSHQAFAFSRATLRPSTNVLNLAARSKPDIVEKKDSKSKEKRPWELGRFLKTLAFYDVLLPNPFTLLKPKTLKSKISKGFVFWSPEEKLLKFGPLDDVVMGGASKSTIDESEKFNGEWKGFTTSANNGGFAGIRGKKFDPPLDASQCSGIELECIGDGQRYKFIARCDSDWNGVAWSSSFDTVKGKTITVRFPFSKLRPTRYARTLTNLSFDPSNLTAIQLSLSKFEYDGGLNPSFREGPFTFTIKKIRTY